MYAGALSVAAFLLGAIIASFILRPRHDQYERPADRDYAHYPTDQDARDAPILVAIAEEIQRSRKEAQTTEGDKRFRETLTVAGIGIYTIVTLGIACIAFYQAHVSKETEMRQLRAYVGPVYCSFNLTNRLIDCVPSTDPNIASPHTHFCIRIKNYGLTPARQTTHCGTVVAINETIAHTRDEVMKWCAQHTFKYHSTVWPTEERVVLGVVDDAELGKIMATQGRDGLLFARISYEDIFGKSHSTEICRMTHFITATQGIINSCENVQGPQDE